MSRFVKQAFTRIVLPVAAILLLMIGLGVLLTHVLKDENGFNRTLEHDRTPELTHISSFFSSVGNTMTIIAVTAVAALILRLTLHRWREPLFLCLAVTAQAVVFFFTTLAIDRPRPDVHRLDASPPTSSFPSGHTSAAFALYVGLAVVLASLARPGWLKALCWLLVLVPLAVATARMYRGMHHPSDVLSACLNSTLCLTVMGRAILNRDVPWRRAGIGSAAPAGTLQPAGNGAESTATS
ncbi:phosphoesterase PA-phosphatase [Actinoplanes sp. SE50]|uniref:phosphatase PAP2 family protein n=1 Tax=unclassified Actinoplanes TaxID=2626549 RepID=UPI00023ECEF0|nr:MULTISPECIES: phosphatase PAP2 family protein [unclassified Actinoplanes]AEV86052.1 Putative lipid phosphate phosphatase 3 [Actinoplanes sp. SE50/110]ATO84450.1 phosphoesterase PA-phosphatase [Actinoplanes sp. SE50]SLM01860.1 phosphoesterase PA-phosphatase [Actinoplanes sp. SE50/110]